MTPRTRAPASPPEILPDWGYPNLDALDDQPPACSVGPVLPWSKSENAERCVRLCPHQPLSFGRFHEITMLPNIRTAPALSALVKLSTMHHEQHP